MKHSFVRALTFLSAATMITSAAQAATIEWSGFGSGRYAQSLSEEVHNSSLDPHHGEFGKFSKIGINLGSALSDKLDVVAQLIAGGSSATTGSQGSEDWDLNVNWAFASYKVLDNLKIKYGRQLLPNFLAAEYAQVGYLQPYREIPQAVSLTSFFKNFNGALVDYTLATPIGNLTTAIWAGDLTTTGSLGSLLGSYTSDVSNLYGGGMTLSGNGYKVRAQYSQTDISFAAPDIPTAYGGAMTTKANLQQTTVGASYDKHNWVVWSEYGHVISTKAEPGLLSADDFFEDASAYYILVGHHFGKYMPRFMYSSADFNKVGLAGINGEEQTYTLGLNYDLTDNAILKFDYEISKFPSGKDGVSTRKDANFSTTSDTEGSAIYASLDFVF